ncbi:MAG TPA: redoxin family protein, partial [Verrucomicrobiales bacterium]|nr:redoxin family protein [Verrucomicrobiales bacterium]
MKTNARSLLKAAACAGALLLTASASLGAPPDFSVKGTTDFLSDIPATLAAQDANKDGKLDSTELGSRSWMLGFMDRNRDGGLDEAELKAGMAKLSRQLFNSRNAAPSTSAPPPFQPAADPRRSPRPLKAAEWAVDTRIPDLELLTTSGERKKLHSLTGKKGTALAMLSPDCPVSRRWFPELQRLEKEYSAKGIAFLFLAAPGEKDTAALQAIGMTGAILTDPDGQLLRTLKATHTTDVFLLDAAKTLIYRGAVDDQYGTGYSRPAPEQRYLAAGLECLLAGTRPATAATEAPGCEL